MRIPPCRFLFIFCMVKVQFRPWPPRQCFCFCSFTAPFPFIHGFQEFLDLFRRCLLGLHILSVSSGLENVNFLQECVSFVLNSSPSLPSVPDFTSLIMFGSSFRIVSDSRNLFSLMEPWNSLGIFRSRNLFFGVFPSPLLYAQHSLSCLGIMSHSLHLVLIHSASRLRPW